MEHRREIEFSRAGKRMQIKYVNEKVVRILRRKGVGPEHVRTPAIAQEIAPSGDFRFGQAEREIRLETGNFRITITEDSIQATPAVISFETLAGEILARETIGTARDMYSKAVFDVKEGTGLYGLGQHQNGLFGYQGTSVCLKHENTSIAIPFLITDAGFGIFWDHDGTVDADFTVPGKMSWTSASGGYVDYYFIYGPSVDEIIREYWKLTGPAPLLPLYAFGFWQSKMRYTTQKELLDVAEKYRKKGYPVDILVIDFYHWTDIGDFKFDPAAWPDPEGMFEHLKALHIQAMVSVWPYISVESVNFREMEQKDLFVYDNSGESIRFTIFNGQKCGLYDPFRPEAREFIWSKAKEHYRQGARIWWLDSCEPDDGLNIGDFLEGGVNTAAGPLVDHMNAYALLHAKAFYEGQRRDFPGRRVLILARAAFAGSQRYATAVWSGDVGYDFKALRTQIAAGLNATMSGLPFWTTDIGGFRGGDTDDPAYRELYIRWFQYGAFCPLFRVHGSRGATGLDDLIFGISRGENELWSFGTELEEIMAKFDRLRYRLLPYIYSCARMTLLTGTPLMRALLIDFAEDKSALGIIDQFMFGKALMVCPVCESGAVSRMVYLPKGSRWYNFWTNETYEGGQTICAEAPLEQIPLFVKAGSIVPLGPDIQHSWECMQQELELRVYAGSDACFELYDDNGETYEYEDGQYDLCLIRWDERKRTLDLEKVHGGYRKADIAYRLNIIG